MNYDLCDLQDEKVIENEKYIEDRDNWNRANELLLGYCED